MNRRGDRSQSETLGVVLILGITVLSVGLLAAYGGVAIDAVQHSVDVQSSEHALSQLDSKVSLVAFGEADRQTVSLGRGRQGAYTVQPDAGRITVTHKNYSNSSTTEMYNQTMGAIRYETGETTIVYQGGGVWRSDGTGGSSMVSTPEFQYRGMTLTLPLIRLSGEGSISGAARADVQSSGPSTKVYPDADQPYPDGSRNYTNPVENGTIEIAVQSEFYRAWASYFEDRTDGQVTVHDENETTVLELASTGTYGDFDMPMEGQAMELRALQGGHSLSNFTVTIAPDDRDSAQFSDLKWSLYAKDGNQELEIHLRGGGSGANGTPVKTTIYYTNDDGSTQQRWYSPDAFEVTENDDGSARVHANLTGDEPVWYSEKTNGSTIQFKGDGDVTDPLVIDDHAKTVDWESDGGETFSNGDSAPIGNITNHYVGLMGPNVDLKVKDGKNQGSADSVNEDASSGRIIVDNTGQYVTFIHVSENNVTVDLR